MVRCWQLSASWGVLSFIVYPPFCVCVYVLVADGGASGTVSEAASVPADVQVGLNAMRWKACSWHWLYLLGLGMPFSLDLSIFWYFRSSTLIHAQYVLLLNPGWMLVEWWTVSRDWPWYHDDAYSMPACDFLSILSKPSLNGRWRGIVHWFRTGCHVLAVFLWCLYAEALCWKGANG